MILLDPADVPLHFAKMCKYMGKDGAADNLFIVFGVTFVRRTYRVRGVPGGATPEWAVARPTRGARPPAC